MPRYTMPRTAHCEGGQLAMPRWLIFSYQVTA